MREDTILQLRMKRQHLVKQASEVEYEMLFSRMSPVPTLFWIEPGSLPKIQYRCDFDDDTINDLNRRYGRILKGRFQGGNVGYVFLDEYPLFMAAYKKDIKRYSKEDKQVLEVIKDHGSVTPGFIKKETGLLAKEVSKSLQKMQKAFIVLETQVEKNNERPFSLVKESLKHLNLDAYTKEEAHRTILLRFMYLNVWVDTIMIKSMTKWNNSEIKNAIDGLLNEKLIVPFSMDNLEGFMRAEDVPLVNDSKEALSEQLFIMDLNDYMVKSQELILKELFPKSTYKTLHYILYKGRFIGRVLGYFRYGPNDLEDVQLLLSREECDTMRSSIIQAIDCLYDNQDNYVKRYCGALVTE